jgi:hypothetical protein
VIGLNTKKEYKVETVQYGGKDGSNGVPGKPGNAGIGGKHGIDAGYCDVGGQATVNYRGRLEFRETDGHD